MLSLKIVKIFLQWFVRCMVLLALGCGLIVSIWLQDLPYIQTLEELEPQSPSVFLSRENKVFAQFSTEYRELARLEELPRQLLDAVLASEDQNFYQHAGFDLWGFGRALLSNIRHGQWRQGGSTITQQIAKILLLTPEKKLKRKFLEIILALELEQTYTKDQLFELYLNTIYFGHGAYGIKTAANIYFSKTPEQLTLAECALIAGLIQGPSIYDPSMAPERALKRRQLVLHMMLNQKKIVQAEFASALQEPLILRLKPRPTTKALDFTESLRLELQASLGRKALHAGGLQVETTLSIPVQTVVEATMEKQLAQIEQRLHWKKDSLQGAALVMDLESGDILAMVGGRGQKAHRFNRALQAKRQPGSLFKVILYAAALDNGMTGATLLEDLPFALAHAEETWTPQNMDQEFWGEITLRNALTHSRNLAAVHLMDALGVELVLDYARRMGIDAALPPYLSLALGAGEVSLLEMMEAFSCIASGGWRIEPRLFRSVVNKYGHLSLQKPASREKALSEKTAYKLSSILRDVVVHGTGKAAAVPGLWVAGKTGTTNDSTDLWFIGFAPPLLMGIWIGSDDRKPILYETGGSAAALVFSKILFELQPQFDFYEPVLPAELSWIEIDSKTGLAATVKCQNKTVELFENKQIPGICTH